jgi:hypothetical protein
MAELFATGGIVDLILVLMIAETLVLAGYRYVTGRGISIMPLLTNMAAGACLLLALRAALARAPWPLIAIALSAAFGMHALDLRSRWSSSRAPELGVRRPLDQMGSASAASDHPASASSGPRLRTS